MTAAIVTRGLTKDYGSGRGIFDCDLEVGEREIFGFLGPNGAGKTTVIRLLMGLTRPTRGAAEVFGLDCRARATVVARQVGYVPGELPQFGGLTGAEIVTHLGRLRGGLDPSIVALVAGRLDLDLGRPYRALSRGTKQKLALLVALMHRPRLLILDEPTGGLDPLNQQVFYRLLREARADGATVFLSSHVLSEVQHVCDRVGIVRAGRLVRVAGLDVLHELRVHEVEVQLADGRIERTTVRGSFEPFLASLAGKRVVRLESREPSLEEVFLSYYASEEPATALARR